MRWLVALLLALLPCVARANAFDTFVASLPGIQHYYPLSTNGNDVVGGNNATTSGSGTFGNTIGSPSNLVSGFLPGTSASYLAFTDQIGNSVSFWIAAAFATTSSSHQVFIAPTALTSNNIFLDIADPQCAGAQVFFGTTNISSTVHGICSTATASDGALHVAAANCIATGGGFLSCSAYLDGAVQPTTLLQQFGSFSSIAQAIGNFPASNAPVVNGAVGAVMYGSGNLTGAQMQTLYSCATGGSCAAAKTQCASYPQATQQWCETWAPYASGEGVALGGNGCPQTGPCTSPQANLNSNLNTFQGTAGGIDASLTATVSGGAVTVVNIVSSGTDYVQPGGPLVFGTQCIVQPTGTYTTSGGAVASANVTFGGSGCGAVTVIAAPEMISGSGAVTPSPQGQQFAYDADGGQAAAGNNVIPTGAYVVQVVDPTHFAVSQAQSLFVASGNFGTGWWYPASYVHNNNGYDNPNSMVVGEHGGGGVSGGFAARFLPVPITNGGMQFLDFRASFTDPSCASCGWHTPGFGFNQSIGGNYNVGITFGTTGSGSSVLLSYNSSSALVSGAVVVSPAAWHHIIMWVKFSTGSDGFARTYIDPPAILTATTAIAMDYEGATITGTQLSDWASWQGQTVGGSPDAEAYFALVGEYIGSPLSNGGPQLLWIP